MNDFPPPTPPDPADMPTADDLVHAVIAAEHRYSEAAAPCEPWCQIRDALDHEDCNGTVRRITQSLRGESSAVEVYPVSWISVDEKPREKQVNIDDERCRNHFALTPDEARHLAQALVACADELHEPTSAEGEN